MKGCLGCLVVGIGFIVILHVGGCLLTIGDIELTRLKNWRNERLARKAEQREQAKVQAAEASRVAEAKRREAEAAAEARRRQAEQIAAQKKRQEAKDEKIRAFALKEAPDVWSVYQMLRSEIDVQSNRISQLRKTLETFGKNPEADEDFKRICSMREEMIATRSVLRKRLEDAYIAKCKFEATPGRREYEEQHRKALEDGIREAIEATNRFNEMRLNK